MSKSNEYAAAAMSAVSDAQGNVTAEHASARMLEAQVYATLALAERQSAQVEATMAVAEQQKRIADWLEAWPLANDESPVLSVVGLS